MCYFRFLSPPLLLQEEERMRERKKKEIFSREQFSIQESTKEEEKSSLFPRVMTLGIHFSPLSISLSFSLVSIWRKSKKRNRKRKKRNRKRKKRNRGRKEEEKRLAWRYHLLNNNSCHFWFIHNWLFPSSFFLFLLFPSSFFLFLLFSSSFFLFLYSFSNWRHFKYNKFHYHFDGQVSFQNVLYLDSELSYFRF